MWMSDNSKFIPVENPNMAETRTAAGIVSVDERIGSYHQIEATYTPEQAAEEASRCLKCPTHWCEKACPAGVPVTDFIAKFRAGDVEGAYQLIRTRSMLPEMCSRVCPQEKQCQSNCTRSIRTMAVGIGRLERYVVEQHYASGKGETAAPATGKCVAIVGSGPSGLGAAQRLLDLGYGVTIFEKNDRAGGLLEYGIPNMKLEKGIVERKLASLIAQGAIIKTGISVGKDISAQELIDGYDAVILAAGTGNARKLSLKNSEGVKGIIPAVDYLTGSTKAVLDGAKPDLAAGKNVVIVGGGDTGNDCVGTALRQGAASITQIEMLPQKTGRQYIFEPHPPRAKEEKHDFSQEECRSKFGDPHVYQTTVKEVSADAVGNLKTITTIDLEAVYDPHFRLSMKEIPGSEKVLPCQLLIVAAGFIGPDAALADAFEIGTTQRSNIDAPAYVTSNPKVFACGDCRTGQSLVVKAMSDGRDCADAVNAALK